MSAGLARWLTAYGAGRGSVVTVLMDRGWEQVAAVLGVLRAGAAYCPVDAGLPAARISQLLGQCQASAVLSQPGRRLPGGTRQLPVLAHRVRQSRHSDQAGVRRAREGRDSALDLAGVAYINRADLHPE